MKISFNWVRWKIIFSICFVIITLNRFKELFAGYKLLLKFAIVLRLFIVVDFLLSCYGLTRKYKPEDMTNFYFLCAYIVFLIVVFILCGKLIKALRKDVENA